ncbi:MAG: phosphate ABC transporter substrate-binding protein [Bacteroidota bacterium]
MKKIILTVTALIMCVSVINAQKVVCKIKGSDTCLPLSQKLSEKFMKKYAGSSISVTGGGSGVGVAALLNSTTDIAQSSRPLSMDEKLKLQEAGKSYKQTIIAYDAISFIVNPANGVSQLTREQLEGIFTGKIKNWKDVGGANMPIVAYSRESSSGTFEFVKEHVLLKKNFAATCMMMAATGAIVQSVSQTKGAIGYVGLAYVESNVKALKVSYDKGKTYVAPTVANAKSKLYPITRPLYYFYLAQTEKGILPFINYILSAEGQQVVLAEGYVPIK